MQMPLDVLSNQRYQSASFIIISFPNAGHAFIRKPESMRYVPVVVEASRSNSRDQTNGNHRLYWWFLRMAQCSWVGYKTFNNFVVIYIVWHLKRDTSFKDCELAILRMAVDKAEKREGSKISIFSRN